MKYLKKFLIYLLTIVVILQCYSLLSMIIPNKYFCIIINILLIGLIVCELKIKRNIRIEMLLVCYLALTALLFISGYYRNFEFLLSVYLPFPLFLLFIMNTNSLEWFMEAFTNIIFIICILSLIFFVFGSLMGIIKPTGYYPYTEIGWGKNNYSDFYHLYCEGQTVVALGYSGVRNISMFVEGPMLTYVIGFAMYYELFFRSLGFRKSFIGVFIITIATSFSTTGILIVIFLMYMKFYDFVKKNKFIKYLIVPIVICIVGYSLFFVVEDKFTSNVYSASARTDDILASFKCFFSNFFNGVGYQNMDAIESYRLFKRSNAGLSTGVGAILAYGGLLWGSWYIVPFIVAIANYIRKPETRKKMAFVIMAFMLLFVTVVQSRILCTIINAICWYFILERKCYKMEVLYE